METYFYVLHWFTGVAMAHADGPVVRFAGPFSHSDEASEWGAAWQEAHGDNPCWQVVEMPGWSATEVVVPVIAPN